MGQAKRKKAAGVAPAVKEAAKAAVEKVANPPPPKAPEPWEPEGALTNIDLQNILGFTQNIPCAGDALDVMAKLRGKIKKHIGHAAVFVPADVAKLVGVDVLQSAMAGEAEAHFLAGVAEDTAGKD